jgi:hypothetical protein
MVKFDGQKPLPDCPRANAGWDKHPKYEAVYANTWQYAVFFLFLYYPTVSVASLKSFSCQVSSPLPRYSPYYTPTHPGCS